MCATHRDGMDAPDIGVGATISPSFDAMIDQGVGATISPSFDTMVGEVISDVAIGVDTGSGVGSIDDLGAGIATDEGPLPPGSIGD
mmetsp:Transcript_37352/g.101139  ORF Transcript_37352/g.101139 Transcript_37352/m.101139 type:complete len:86 (-) Transcript_37352:162-419(-)